MDVVGKYANSDRNLYLFRNKEGQLVFKVQTSGRDASVRQPVKRDVVENVVSRKTLGLAVEDARDELVTFYIVIDYPRSKADRRIRDSVQRLRASSHLLRIGDVSLKEEVELIPRMLLVG